MIHWKALCSESLLTQGPSKCILLLKRRRKKKAIIDCNLYVPHCVVLEKLGGVPGSPVCISSGVVIMVWLLKFPSSFDLEQAMVVVVFTLTMKVL